MVVGELLVIVNTLLTTRAEVVLGKRINIHQSAAAEAGGNGAGCHFDVLVGAAGGEVAGHRWWGLEVGEMVMERGIEPQSLLVASEEAHLQA
jgi:hypothetical protein